MAITNQDNKASFYIKRISGLILLLALAAVFFFSAITKLIDMEAFEWSFIDMGIGNMVLASVIAHIFIGIELLIGAFLVFHIYLKQVTYPITLAMLVVFTIYLIVLVVQQGNEGNCGCFGEQFEMKPVQAIIKNIIMMGATILLMFIYPIKPYKGQEWFAAVIGMVAMVTAFVVAPLNTDHKPQRISQPLPLHLLYKDKYNKPDVELRTGKHIIAYMSLTCPHCKKAAYLLYVLKRQDPTLPIYIVLSGDAYNIQPFLKETKATNIPYLLYKDMNAFIDMAGDGVPAIYWVNNGQVEYKSNYFQLDPKDIKDWLSQ